MQILIVDHLFEILFTHFLFILLLLTISLFIFFLFFRLFNILFLLIRFSFFVSFVIFLIIDWRRLVWCWIWQFTVLTFIRRHWATTIFWEIWFSWHFLSFMGLLTIYSPGFWMNIRKTSVSYILIIWKACSMIKFFLHMFIWKLCSSHIFHHSHIHKIIIIHCIVWYLSIFIWRVFFIIISTSFLFFLKSFVFFISIIFIVNLGNWSWSYILISLIFSMT